MNYSICGRKAYKPPLKMNTICLISMADRTRKHWPKKHCYWTRKEVAEEVRRYRRHNDHRAVNRAYMRGDSLYGKM